MKNNVIAFSHCIFSFVQEYYSGNNKVFLILKISQLSASIRKRMIELINDKTRILFSSKHLPLDIIYTKIISTNENNVFMNSLFGNIEQNNDSTKPYILYHETINNNYKIENADHFFESGICIYAAMNRNIDMLKKYYSEFIYDTEKTSYILNMVSSILYVISTNGFIKNDKYLSAKAFDIVYSQKVKTFLYSALDNNNYILSHNLHSKITLRKIYNEHMNKCQNDIIALLIYGSNHGYLYGRTYLKQDPEYGLVDKHYADLFLKIFDSKEYCILEYLTYIHPSKLINYKYVCEKLVIELCEKQHIPLDLLKIFEHQNVYNSIFIPSLNLETALTICESLSSYNMKKNNYFDNIQIVYFLEGIAEKFKDNNIICITIEITTINDYCVNIRDIATQGMDSDDDEDEDEDNWKKVEQKILKKRADEITKVWKYWEKYKSEIIKITKSKREKIFTTCDMLMKMYGIYKVNYPKLLNTIKDIQSFSTKNVSLLILYDSYVNHNDALNSFVCDLRIDNMTFSDTKDYPDEIEDTKRLLNKCYSLLNDKNKEYVDKLK